MGNHQTDFLSDEEIITRSKSGSLFANLGRPDFDEGDSSSLVNRCIELHNANKLDLLALTKDPKFSELSVSDFFDRQVFLSKVIPRLQASEREMMQAVEILVKRAGEDLAANRPLEAFRDWCAADLRRAKYIIASARGGDTEAANFLTFALVALQDPSLARSIALEHADQRRLSGLVALGRIKVPDAADAEVSLKTLISFVEETNDDAVRCNALVPVFQLCEQVPSLSPIYLPAAVALAIEAPSHNLRFNLARGLWSHFKIFDRASIAQVLTTLKSIDRSLGRLLEEIDTALRTVLLSSNGDLAVDYLSDVLGQNKEFGLRDFETTKHELATRDQQQLFRVVVRWLLSNNILLERTVPELLRTGEDTAPFEASLADLSLSSSDSIFLARKTLGWLFFNQAAAASILVACLRDNDPATAAEISKLLFDPLLVNYGGKTRDYLATIKSSDRAYRYVRKAVKTADAYLADLKSGHPIKELRPSDYQLNVEHQRARDFMHDIQKQAEKKSIFRGLVHRSVLLYGRRSITYLHEPGKKAHPIRMDLHSFSHSFEIPRLEIIDPIGLSLKLYSFRSEKRK